MGDSTPAPRTNSLTDPVLTLQERTLAAGEKKPARAIYSAMHIFVNHVMYRYFRMEMEGEDRLSTLGPVIIAPVHRSNVDVLLVSGGSNRRFRSLAKESMFKGPVLSWLWAALGSFPVQRGAADRDALNAARMLLDRGEPVLVFPEGTRQSGRGVADVFDGVAYLAAKTGARVVPVGLAGTEEALPPGAKFPRPSRVQMVVGDVIEPPFSPSGRVTRSLRDDFSAELHASLQRAQDLANEKRDARS